MRCPPLYVTLLSIAPALGPLALRHAEGIPRDTLRDLVWPDSAAALAGEALHSRVYSLNKLLGGAMPSPRRPAPPSRAPVAGSTQMPCTTGTLDDDVHVPGDLAARRGGAEVLERRASRC
jgi:hypothetical protein